MKYILKKPGFIMWLLFGIPMLSMCTPQNTSDKMNSDTTKTSVKTIMVDVRTTEEWNFDGHAKCSVSIPLDQLEKRMQELKGYDRIVLVCRSGNRAGVAKRMLEGAGFRNIENLGAWQNLECDD